MIKYALKCSKNHRFDSWFQSGDAFDRLLKAGHITCEICGSPNVTKSLMAPAVTIEASAPVAQTSSEPEPTPAPAPAPLADGTPSQLEQMRKHVEDNSDYVGMNFAQEARDMHEGNTQQRPIYGEAKFEDAKSLIEDGIPVAPLPFIPKRKVN